MQSLNTPELLSPLTRRDHLGSAAPLGRMHPHHPSPDIATGHLVVDPEIVLKAKGFNFSEDLYYSNGVSEVTEFGLSRSASTRAFVDTSGGIVINRGDFAQAAFQLKGSSGTVSTYIRSTNERNNTTLVYDSASQEFTEWVSDSMKLVYKSQTGSSTKHELCRVENTQGIAQTYTYGTGVEAGLLKSVEVPGGKKVTFTYAAGTSTSLVSSIEDWGNRRWTFQYDASSRLTTFTTPLGCSTKYTYSLAGSTNDMLHVIEDPRGYRTTYMYDTSSRVVSMAAGSAVWTYTYEPDRTIVTPSGAVTTFVLDGDGNVASAQMPEGFTSTYTYNTNRLQVAEQRPCGYVMSMSYWGDGADDPYTTKAMLSLPKWTADAFGNRTSLSYDSSGNLTKIEFPDGGVVTQVWSGNLLSARIDPLGRATSYTYTGDGLLRTVQDARGLVTTMNYDSEGNVASVVYSNGGVVTNTYDSLSRLSTSTDPLGRTTTYAYDAGDNLTAVTNPAGETTTYIYDGCLRVAVVNPLGFRTTYTYNRFAAVATVKNALGYVTTMNYDVEGRQIETVNALGFITTQVYNPAGQRVAVIDALGNRTSFTYDNSGRPETVKNALGFVSTSVYDARDQIATVDALGSRTTYTYDNMRRQTAVQNARGFVSTTVYDLAGQVTASIDAIGSRTTMTYNAVGARESVKNPRGFITTFLYESNSNQLSASIDELGIRTTFIYDLGGQMTARQDALSSRITFAYDAVGRQKSIQNEIGLFTTMSYDAAGRVVTVLDANGWLKTHTYDAVDQQTGTEFSDGTRFTFAYDSIGRMTTMADTTGTATSVYDAVGRLTDKTDPGALRQQYSYDAVGNRTRLVEPDGKVRTFTYTERNETHVFIDEDARKTTFLYDSVGQNTTVLFDSGLRFYASFDGNGQNTVGGADYGDGHLMSQFAYSYDGAGNRTVCLDTVFDSTQTMTYDAKNRLTRWQGNVITAKDYTYSYNAVDNRLTDTETGVVRTWSYDAASRLTTMSDGSSITTFTFDANGNNTGVNEAGALTTMAYDRSSRMTAYSDGSGTVNNSYNARGQKISSAGTTLVWDGWDYLGEVNSGTFDKKTYTIDSMILAEKANGSERLDFEKTALGSVCTKYDQTNEARAGVQRYKPYGALEFHDSTLPTWQFVGGWGYRPTNLSWADYYVRNREYGTMQALWTTVDSLFPKGPPFVYCGNNPTTLLDSSGQDLLQDLKNLLGWLGVPGMIPSSPPMEYPLPRPKPIGEDLLRLCNVKFSFDLWKWGNCCGPTLKCGKGDSNGTCTDKACEKHDICVGPDVKRGLKNWKPCADTLCSDLQACYKKNGCHSQITPTSECQASYEAGVFFCHQVGRNFI